MGTNLQTYANQIDAVLAAVPAAGHPSQVQEGRRRLDAQRHPQEVQREAVEAALLEGGLLQGVAAQGVLLTTPQPQGMYRDRLKSGPDLLSKSLAEQGRKFMQPRDHYLADLWKINFSSPSLGSY